MNHLATPICQVSKITLAFVVIQKRRRTGLRRLSMFRLQLAISQGAAGSHSAAFGSWLTEALVQWFAENRNLVKWFSLKSKYHHTPVTVSVCGGKHIVL
jgi:hypothetical protein